MLYVWHHAEQTVLEDKGHMWLGHEEVSMHTLDMLSLASMLFFVVGTLWLRDLRLWVKVLTCAALLFFSKGAIDYMTELPDSIGWERCQARLKDEGVNFFKSLHGLSDGVLFQKMLKMELGGLSARTGGVIWPVRYCSDMLLSGHTFAMFLSLLGSCDVARRMTMLASPTSSVVAVCLIMTFTLLCQGADLYFIIINHFHYTVDVALSLVVTLLLYTNAGVAIFTDWFVEVAEEASTNERFTTDNGMIWIPPFCIPFCCFNGYYAVVEMDAETVINRQQKNRSSLFQRLQMLALGDAAATEGEIEPLNAKGSEAQSEAPKQEIV